LYQDNREKKMDVGNMIAKGFAEKPTKTKHYVEFFRSIVKVPFNDDEGGHYDQVLSSVMSDDHHAQKSLAIPPGNVGLQLKGRIYEVGMSKETKMFVNVMKPGLQLFGKPGADDINDSIFKDRLSYFMEKCSENTWNVTLEFPKKLLTPPHNVIEHQVTTNKDGHFKFTLLIPKSHFAINMEKENMDYRLREPFNTSISDLNFVDRRCGPVTLIPTDAGITVVSDIDDTIKDSFVCDKKELLWNTFCRNFRVVPGMSELYNKWKEEVPQLTFHYLSGSPYQIFRPLRKDFFDHFNFPSGVYHLRKVYIPEINEISPKQFFTDALSGEKGNEENIKRMKLKTIRRLMRKYPKNVFILVGDSSEMDPEAYGEIAREYPGRVKAIFIRSAPLPALPGKEKEKEPTVCLDIKVLNAENLPIGDKLEKTSDPFTSVKFKGLKQKTEAIDNTLDPEWNQHLTFALSYKEGEEDEVIANLFQKEDERKLVVRVKDLDIGKNDLLATYVFDFSSGEHDDLIEHLKTGEQVVVPLNLEIAPKILKGNKKYHGKGQPTLKIRLQVMSKKKLDQKRYLRAFDGIPDNVPWQVIKDGNDLMQWDIVQALS